MLLESVEFLIHVDYWIENQGEQVNRIKATDFVANLISSSRNVKLFVTSSENVEFPSLGKEKITQGAFKPEQLFNSWKLYGRTRQCTKHGQINFQIYVVTGIRAISCQGRGGGAGICPIFPQVAQFFTKQSRNRKIEKSFTGAFFSNTVASMFRKVKAKSVTALSRYFGMNFLSLKIR